MQSEIEKTNSSGARIGLFYKNRSGKWSLNLRN